MTIKVHLAKRSKWFGGNKLSSLCGRVRLLTDGMNLTDEHNEVTCAFCRKIIDAKTSVAASTEISLPRYGCNFNPDRLEFDVVRGGKGQRDGTFVISPARYAKRKVIVSTTGHVGFQSRACRLASSISRGNYTRRGRGYVMSPAQAERFFKLFTAGWDASLFGDLLEPPRTEA